MKCIDEQGTYCIIPNEHVDRIDYMNTNYYNTKAERYDDTMIITLTNGQVLYCKESTYDSQEGFVD